MSHAIALTVNGRRVEIDVPAHALLLDVLRDRLDLKGAKRSCDLQVCGACTVLVDGAPVSACTYLAVEADGREVLTVEGLASVDALHPLQQSFIDHGAVQCGFCTSGMLLSAEALLDEEADELVFAAVASEEEQFLVGQRFPSSTGIAGWVASSQTPLVLEDVQADPRFARDIAEQSGYVPKGIMAVPLLDEERVLGVLQVLDRPSDARFSLREMELLGLFAGQAAIALSLMMTARSARAARNALARTSASVPCQ